MSETPLHSRRVELAPDADPVEHCFEQGWTDGLPVVPPTEEKVRAMLAATARDPRDLVAQVPPQWGRATVERVAVNAVLAGGKPEYFPVLLAAVEAISDPAFNLHGVQVTTGIVTPLLIVNGPMRGRIGINCAGNVFGQGFRANATIGRALRLVMTNVGGALPQELDRATFGHPGKFAYCIGEYEEVSPWEALHVERGFRPEESAVTVFAAGAPQSINDHASSTAEDILTTIARSLAVPGSPEVMGAGETVIALSPEHARTIGSAGWSKADVKKFLQENARCEVSGRVRHLADSVDQLILLVAGGTAGRFSVGISGWGTQQTRSVTRRIEL